jgi:hypothetical protein
MWVLTAVENGGAGRSKMVAPGGVDLPWVRGVSRLVRFPRQSLAWPPRRQHDLAGRRIIFRRSLAEPSEHRRQEFRQGARVR